jgi:hypothetical protein
MALTRCALLHPVPVTHCLASAPNGQLEGPHSSCHPAEACHFFFTTPKFDLPAWVDTFGVQLGSLWQPCDNGNGTAFSYVVKQVT